MITRFRRLIRYTEGNEQQAVQRAVKTGHIDAFVQFCGSNERSTDLDTSWQTLKLISFPNKYTFDRTGKWKRKQPNAKIGLGRMYPVHPNNVNQFYLRMLLCNLTGADVRELALQANNDRELCCVCYDRQSDVKLHPCDMIIMCRGCADQMQANAFNNNLQTFVCPFCRADVTSYTTVQDTYDARPLDAYTLKGRHDTFKDACLARGLLANDGEWQAAMEDASQTATDKQLRVLFMHIISNCAPEHPFELFEMFCLQMGDEFRTFLDTLGISTDANVRTCVLYELRNGLDEQNKNDKKALDSMPRLTEGEADFIVQIGQQVSKQLAYAYDYDMDEELDSFNEKYELCLNVRSQRDLIDGIKELTKQAEQFLLFVDAPGGCGKTFCFQCLLAYYRSLGKVAIAVATTGIAALQLDGGKTAHTSFRIPFDSTGSRRGLFSLGIKSNSTLGKLLREDVELIIWDEAPMINKDIFDTVDDWMKRERDDQRPFGGVNVILGGDFRQVLPVVRGGTRADQTTASIVNSEVFKQFNMVHLYKNIRVENCKISDPDRSNQLNQWAEDLKDIGNGTHILPEDVATFSFECVIPDSVRMKPINTMSDVDDMIDDVFGDLTELSKLSTDSLAGHECMQSAILCPVHQSVDEINARCLDKWVGDTYVKYAIDSYENPNDAMVVTLEQLNVRTPTGSPPARLELKIGMPLVMLRNMSEELMNGTRVLLLDIRNNVLQCKVLNGRYPNTIVYIPRFVFKHEGPDQPLTWSRRQYPVKPCWSMTINKSQAQTLERVAVCLIRIVISADNDIVVEPYDVFSHGQMYVGLSRCGDPDKVCIYTTEEHCRTRTLANVVYKEALIEYPGNPSVPNFPNVDNHRTDVHDIDVLYDARCHLSTDDTLDVPHHGYVFGDTTDVNWNGTVGTADERTLNLSDRDDLQTVDAMLAY